MMEKSNCEYVIEGVNGIFTTLISCSSTVQYNPVQYCTIQYYTLHDPEKVDK